MTPVPILLYHRVGYDKSTLTTSPQDFESHLQWLSSQGVSFLSCAELESVLGGQSRRSGKRVLITFDDGYRELYEVALPLMQRYGAKGAAFVITGRMRCLSAPAAGAGEFDGHLSLPEVRAIQESGILEVHSHTHRHENWLRQTPRSGGKLDLLREDLGQSREFLSDSLRLPLTHFRHLAWPWGACNLQLIDVARSVGFSYQYFVQFAAANRIGMTDRLPRFCCDGMPIDAFRRRVEVLMNGKITGFVNSMTGAHRRLRGRFSY
ncbi:MAG: polysaccharide deacetylase family protein [Betaproteobacteria bacterium]|nr:polysaccharide deacetylase family protein [Betaproteobacteria bacterium]